MRLRDQSILVTGSSRGIGRAIAERCVAEGARVLVHGLEEAPTRDVAEALGPCAAAHACDLAEPAAAVELVEAVLRAHGRIDGLVNNAGISPRSDVESTSAEFFDRVMAINARAPLLLIRAALPALVRSRGRVVNIGSINAHCGEEGLLAYSMTKGALMTLSRNLGDALHRHGVRVNHLNPGWVLTDNERKLQREAGLPDDWPRRLGREQIPSGAMTRPDQVAATVVHWLSADSEPFSGSVIDLEQFPVIGRNPPKEV